MVRLDVVDLAERRRHGGETLFVRDLRELGIQGAPLHLLAVSGVEQVLLRAEQATRWVGRGDLRVAALEVLVEDLGVLALVLCGLHEDRRDLFVALLSGYRRVVPVAVARLALAGEGLEQILLSARAFDAHVRRSSRMGRRAREMRRPPTSGGSKVIIAKARVWESAFSLAVGFSERKASKSRISGSER